MSGHHRHASEAPFKWRYAGGPMMARLSGIWTLPPFIKLKKKRWIPSDKIFWIRACLRFRAIYSAFFSPSE